MDYLSIYKKIYFSIMKEGGFLWINKILLLKNKKLIARRNALKLFFIRFPDVDPIFLENLSTKQYEELFDLLLIGKNLDEIKKAILDIA